MKSLHIETPFIESRALTLRSGRPVWLKMEALQPPGSFKIRGIGLKCQEQARRGAMRLVSSSGGNAGIAVAYAGRQLSLPVTVVVPQTTSERARTLIRQEGAELMVHGPSWQEANAMALSLLGEHDAFIHPFDDPLMWSGHATMVDEIARSEVRPDAVVLSVGGGGLLSGVVEGLHRNGWSDLPVIAVETRGADSLAQSVSAGHRVELPAITSIASSLGARQVCQQAFDWTSRHPVLSVVVSDREAVAACQAFVADHRIVVEPACGAALAVVYGQRPEIQSFKTIAVIVCGGVTATIDQLNQWSVADLAGG
ncbi:MAG: serine dehydratase [Burkholderiales bacterium RIFCSPHIGHO2_12_FULL_67_38]|nr:MAG: serine dehydratase [Burkholderiales bacterium RIFCSPLOWO2_02_FULL_67_64]OGB40448.1 MAG: serine dehydratase [Burkholderiales bacterium RIFCSPHIGHO2_12_FULL_67_38]OGB99799.1 MAG: serine dehydratase [Burkholderiales bacterium RIFCSPLOWO2_12_FULL_67_210]